MPLTIKTFANLVQLIKAKFTSTLPSIDPNINGGLAQSVAVSAAIAGYALQDVLQDAVNQSFIPTQDDDFLAISGNIDNTPQLQPTAATGFAAVGGTLTTLIPQFTNLTFGSLIFQTLLAANITANSGTIGTLNYNANGTVTAVTSVAHTLSSNLSVTITGATQTQFNGTFTVTVLDNFTFQYTIGAGLGLSTDSGSYSSNYALLNVQCTTTGSNTNVGASSGLSINVPGVNSTAYVGIGQLLGGTDLETSANYRTRVLQAHNLTPGVATIPSLISSLKKVTGVTRIWVIPAVVSAIQVATRGTAGYFPLLGETLIYVVDDNINPITPTSPILAACLAQIATDGVFPGFIPAANFWIIAPNLVTPYISMHLTANNTTSMQTAIATQLAIFFQENATVSVNVSVKALNTFIQNIQDPNTGLFVASNYTFNGWGFVLGTISPTSDLIIASGGLAVAGTVAGGTIIFN